MSKFNIAYVPKSKSDRFIKLTENFSSKAHNYCLGKHSLPHVTICQFFSDESQINEIWDEVCSSIDDGEISFSFKKLSHLSFDQTIFWLSLLPDFNKKLIDTFNIISGIVEPIRKDEYDPHLTLFNYRKGSMDINSALGKKMSIDEEFELVLGESDEAGQLVRIICIYTPLLTRSFSPF